MLNADSGAAVPTNSGTGRGNPPSARRLYAANRILLLGGYILCAAAFFFVPMAFAPDSEGYLAGAYSLLNGEGFAGLSAFRGPVIPITLALFLKLFGRTVFAVQLCWFLYYSILYFSAWKLVETLGLFENRRGWISWPLFIFALMLNPCVMAYGHLCLTELPALSMLALYAAVLTSLHCRERAGTGRKNAVARLCCVAGFTVLVYAVKQAAFPVVPVIFLLCELMRAVERGSWKKLWFGLVAVFVSALLLLGYLRIWNNTLPDGSIEGDSVSSFAGSFLVDGLRYFRVTERAVYGRPVSVEVMSDDYEQVEQSFTYTFDGSLRNVLAYWWDCLKISPAKVLRGYVQNYLLVTGSRHLLGASGAERAYAKVNETTEFFTGQETAAWTDAFAQLPQERQQNLSLTAEGLEGGERDVAAYNGSLPRKLLFNSYYRKLAYFQYSFTSYHALLIALVSIAGGLMLRKRGEWARVLQINALCAGTLFLQIAFLAVTAQGIDRYGFPLVLFSFVLVANTASAAGDWLLRRCPGKNRKKSHNP